jgi:hypothetical protein
MPTETIGIIDLIDAVLNGAVTSESTKVELRAFREQASAGSLDRDDYKYVVALCNRLLGRPSPPDEHPKLTEGISRQLSPVPEIGTAGRAVITSVTAMTGFVQISFGLVFFIALLALPVLIAYAVIVILFREAFGVELPNPLHWISHHR